MSDEERDSERLELEIYGLVFRLRAPVEEHDRLKRAGRQVDNAIRELAVSQKTPDSTRLAIQAAFLISHDFIKLMDDFAAKNGVTDETRRRVDDLLQRIDDSISSF
ncbi:MAG: cell division protein ZapA [Candidatus Sumerlaeaceae bacterium]|nr:cell division protein ZapA [Candidatus Sumerlaeaceae bacterium]